jgi:hypothetical protein
MLMVLLWWQWGVQYGLYSSTLYLYVCLTMCMFHKQNIHAIKGICSWTQYCFCLHNVWFLSTNALWSPYALYVHFSSEILYYLLLLYDTDQEYIMISLPLATSPAQFKYRASLWAVTVFPLAGIPTNATIKGPNFFWPDPEKIWK